MSAEVLRRAAAAMRGNAMGAEQGRWKLWGMTVMADPKGTSNVDDAIRVAEPYTPSTHPGQLRTFNATHIASWHPAVALAVADWLDAEAQSHFHLGDAVKSSYDLPGMDESPAMRVARAYLGTPDPEATP